MRRSPARPPGGGGSPPGPRNPAVPLASRSASFPLSTIPGPLAPPSGGKDHSLAGEKSRASRASRPDGLEWVHTHHVGGDYPSEASRGMRGPRHARTRVGHDRGGPSPRLPDMCPRGGGSEVGQRWGKAGDGSLHEEKHPGIPCRQTCRIPPMFPWQRGDVEGRGETRAIRVGQVSSARMHVGARPGLRPFQARDGQLSAPVPQANPARPCEAAHGPRWLQREHGRQGGRLREPVAVQPGVQEALRRRRPSRRPSGTRARLVAG